MGFLMTLQQPLPQIALTWFIPPFTTLHNHRHPHPPATAPPFFLQHLQSSIHSTLPPSVLTDRYTACTRDTISSSAPRQWQETSVFRSLCHKVLESGKVTHSIGQPGKACGQSGVELAGVWGRPGGNLSPGPSCLACLVPFVSVCACFVRLLQAWVCRSEGSKASKTTKGCLEMSSASLCFLPSASDAFVFLFDFAVLVCDVHKPSCVFLLPAAVRNCQWCTPVLSHCLASFNLLTFSLFKLSQFT